MKQDYDFTTPYGERIFTTPGNNGPDDMKIFTEFPSKPCWRSTKEYADYFRWAANEIEKMDE